MGNRYNMEVCIWYDSVYTPLVNEISTWAKVKNVVTTTTKLIIVLYSKDKELYETTVRSLGISTRMIPVVSSPTLNFVLAEQLYSISKRMQVQFFFLDYKPFDSHIRSLHTGKFVKHVDIKTYYSDGPPIGHETFHNMSSVLEIMGDKQFNYTDAKANLMQHRESCNLTTMRCGAATCVLYSGVSDCGNIDVIHVYGDDKKYKSYINELDMPSDCLSYYERYGACIQLFLQNVNVLDRNYHEKRVKMIMSKFKATSSINIRIR